MKKILLLFLLMSVNVFATAGNISDKSVFECNGKYYGSHGNPVHFHEVIKKDGKWVINSKEVDIPNCYIKPINEQEKVLFSKCVDGDTAKLIINGKEETVRFLAIDTPEVAHNNVAEEPYGNAASNFTCNSLKNAHNIVLEYDANSDKTDKYGRVLAFVFVDDVLLEKSLIENGLAKVYYIYGDYNYVDELRKAEEKAKNENIGIWSLNMPDVSEQSEDNKDIETIIRYLKLIWEYLVKIFDFLIN